MARNTIMNKSNRFLIINLVLLLAFIVCLLIVIVIYQVTNTAQPVSTATATLVPSATVTPGPSATTTLTPTASNTPRPSATPTTTLTPTWTVPVTLSPTPTGPATLIAMQPAIDHGIYNLKDWTAEETDRMVTLMEYYPESLSTDARGKNDTTYYEAFKYVILALKESLLRFPEASQADKWRWELAYNLARTGDPQAGRNYGELIAAGLNRDAASVETLYIWFQNQEPRLSLHMVELTPPSGYIGSYLIELRGSGSAFIWLLQTTSAYRADSVLTNFDFELSPEAGWIVAELNGNPEDGEEVAIYFANQPGNHTLQAPRIYNLGRFPSKELNFMPDKDIYDPGVEFNNYWAIRPNNENGNDLVFRTNILPACPLTVRRYYRWNGAFFDFISSEYSLESLPFSLSYCEYTIEHATNSLGPQAAIAVMETLSPDWPPARNQQGDPYVLDALDEWRYRLGLQYALFGEPQTAKGYFDQILNTPTTKLSRWIEPARKFLETYKQPGDIYRACQLTSFCDTRFAIEFLVENLPEGQDALQYLQSSGVFTNASGYYDFDGDDNLERWFSLRPRSLEQLELWILTDNKVGAQALFVDTIDTNVPALVMLEADYIGEQALHLQPVTFLDGRLAFSMRRRPQDFFAYLVTIPMRQTYPDRFQEMVDAAKRALFNGLPPENVKKNLLSLESWPGLLCQGLWTCDEYYYLLGLTSALAGDESGAVEAYHKLWSDYTRSPFTTMARLKILGGEKPPTPTLIPSSTATATSEATNTTSGTTTATATPTATVSGTQNTSTPTLTPTATTAVTSLATATATLIPTVTPYP